MAKITSMHMWQMLQLRKSDTKHGLWLDCFSNTMRDCMDRYRKTKSSKGIKINNSMKQAS
jgi:hypothetical protein